LRTATVADDVLEAWAAEVSVQIRRHEANRRHPLRRNAGLPYRAARLYVRKSRELGTARATRLVVDAVLARALHR